MMQTTHSLIMIHAAVLLTSLAHGNPPVVQTSHGPIVGKWGDSQTQVFLGIPYAAPPIGTLRFAPAQAPTPWTEPIKTDQFSLAAVQPKPRSYQGIGERGEDCLHLNVFTARPSISKSRKLPVLFWVHGGGFTSGTAMSNNYNATVLAADGLCVVVPNYRLGVMGFLAHPALTEANGSSGNQALSDLLQALEWTSANIAKFGGDPENITIAGQSAGGSAIAALMCMPQTKGLFHKAIIQSGGASGDLPQRYGGTDSAEDFGRAVVKNLQSATKDQSDQKSLRSASTDDLLAAWFAVSKERGRMDLCIDGTFLVDSPMEIFAKGHHRKVPMIVGNTATEGSMFLLLNDVDTPNEYRNWMARRFGAHHERALTLYPVRNDDFESQQLSVMNDYYDTHARFIANNVTPDAWRYRFTRVSPFGETMALGSFHGAEIAYLFGRVEISESYNAIDVALAKRIREYWISFCQTGNPNGEGRDIWPRYDGQKQFIVFDETVSIDKNWRPRFCDFIEQTWRTP